MNIVIEYVDRQNERAKDRCIGSIWTCHAFFEMAESQASKELHCHFLSSHKAISVQFLKTKLNPDSAIVHPR
jgi:hypothetical protein